MITFDDILKKYSLETYENNKSIESKYGKQLIKLRLSSGLDLDTFAKRLNLTSEEYIRYEYGEKEIPVTEYKRLISRIKI